jgi:hypothetical protein
MTRTSLLSSSDRLAAPADDMTRQIFRFCGRNCCRSQGSAQMVVRLMSLPSSMRWPGTS